MPVNLYCTIAELREEGFRLPQYPDSLLTRKIRLASTFIESVTGRWFGPKVRTLLIDGEGGPFLTVGVPIISITTVTLVYDVAGVTSSQVIDLESLQVYNRHLTMGLTNPDDRDAPRIELRLFAGGDFFLTAWPDGAQNVKLEGVFGYTELDADDTVGETSEGSQVPLAQGVVPADLTEVCMRLVARNLPLVSDTDGQAAATRAGEVIEEKTREQMVKYGKGRSEGDALSFGLTGDKWVDGVLSRYMRPPHMAYV